MFTVALTAMCICDVIFSHGYFLIFIASVFLFLVRRKEMAEHVVVQSNARNYSILSIDKIYRSKFIENLFCCRNIIVLLFLDQKSVINLMAIAYTYKEKRNK